MKKHVLECVYCSGFVVKDLSLEPNSEPGVCREELAALEKCRRGSRKAFEVLVNKYMKDAYFIALGFVGNREDAQDLSQEAFVRAYRNIKKIRPESGFFPWFYQILKNLCISHLRKRKHRRAQSLDVEGCPEAEAPNDNFSPNEIAERNENKDRVWQAIGRLDPKHREVIILRHFQNMSYEQIAEALFCNKGTVTSRLYYARKHLEELLKVRDSGFLTHDSQLQATNNEPQATETSGEKGGAPDDMP